MIAIQVRFAGLKLETSVFESFTVANLSFDLVVDTLLLLVTSGL